MIRTSVVVLGCAAALLATSCRGHRGDIGAKVVLNASDVPGFTQFLPTHCDESGAVFGPGGRKLDRVLTEETCTSGFLVDAAVSGEGRAQIDAQTRAGGNEPGDPSRPSADMPIHGVFVASHHGAFEIYDTVYRFSTEELARQTFQTLAYPAQPDDTPREDVPSQTFGDERRTQKSVLGPTAEEWETNYQTVWRRGTVVGWVRTAGAADIDPHDVSRLAAIIDDRLKQALR